MSDLDSPIRGLRPILFGATAAALAFAFLGSVTSGALRSTLAGVSVAIVITVPLLRVVVVGGHWWRIGDRRFAAIAAALLAVVGSGALIALL